MAGEQFPRIPKVREYAQVQMIDGSVITGHIFVEATSRIQDVLNGPAPFMPFIDDENVVHILNKSAIMRVRPFDT